MPQLPEKKIVEKEKKTSLDQTKETKFNLTNEVERAVNLGVWDYQINTGVLQFNSQFVDLFETPKEEVYYNFDFLINNILPEDTTSTLKALNDHITGHTTFFTAEYRIKTKSGKIKWLQQQGRVIEKDEHHNASRMVGVVSDITELKNSFQELTRSEAQVKAFLKLIPDNIFILNRKGIIVDAYLNETKNRRFSLENVIDKKFEELFFNEQNPEFEYLFCNAIESKKVQYFEFTVDDKKVPSFYECRLLYADLKNILAIVRDITAEKHSEEALKQSEEELKRLNETKDRLFSIIGHDLKSPFNNILGFADMLNENYENLSAEKIKEYLSYIRISTGQAFALFENLLEWSRAQSSKIHPYPNPFDINKLIDKNLALLSAQARQKEINIVANLSNETILNADANMISTVLRNIISNAIKFTKLKGEILIEKIVERNKVTILIKDNGIGMPTEINDKLFKINENISRKGTSGEKGTGLGLLLCKDFMEKNNGEITYKSEEGVGTTFFLSFKL